MIFSHGITAEDKRRRGERRHHPLENKPIKEKLHYQESALDKKHREEASMEEENKRERRGCGN